MAAGAVMGFINNLAGAGGLIGLAALDLAAGLGPTDANASLRPAALAISTAGLLGFLSKGQRIPGKCWLYGLASAPGAVAGSILAVTLPTWVYQLALVAIVVAVLTQQFLGPRAHASTEPNPRGGLVAFFLFSLVGIHMGFLQVAVGLVTMLVLSMVLTRDLVAVNAAKMAILMVTATCSVISLSTMGAVSWTPALWLAAGAGIGSFVAGRWTVGKGHAAVRVVVLVVCAFVLLRLAFQVSLG